MLCSVELCSVMFNIIYSQLTELMSYSTSLHLLTAILIAAAAAASKHGSLANNRRTTERASRQDHRHRQHLHKDETERKITHHK